MSTSKKNTRSKKNIAALWLSPTFLRYAGIGGLVFGVNIIVFKGLLEVGVHRPVATTIAYALAVAVHFTLNKFLNFRNFERSILQQLRTYLAVVTFCWVITLIIVEVGVEVFALPPLGATIVAIAINIPIGFLGNRYLTFEGGIRAAWQRFRRPTR